MKYGEKAIEDAQLEIWDNPFPEHDYIIDINFSEFTCLCPRSGYPDFAIIYIKYIPIAHIVELRSLKHYLNKYRNAYINHEEVTNKIFQDLNKLLTPKFLEVRGDFNIRGGIKTVVTTTLSNNENRKQ